MPKIKIFKTAQNLIKTTPDTRIGIDMKGNYTLTGEYFVSDKRRFGEILIKAEAISYIETVEAELQ